MYLIHLRVYNGFMFKKINSKISNKLFFVAGAVIVVAVTLGLFLMFKSNPLTYYDMIKKAEAYTEEGKIAFALEEYRKMLRLYPGNYDIHLKLGNLYEKINEIDRAKVQYIMAIRLEQKSRPEAYIKLAKVYCRENKYKIAEDIISDIKDTWHRDALEEIGNIYSSWGEKLRTNEKLEAIRKFKEARKYYKKAKSKLEKIALENIFGLYANISDELLVEKKFKKAEEALNLSIDYEDNALAHYKLAQMYENKYDDYKAIKEYSKAFKLDPNIAGKNSYIDLLLRKAHELKQKGDNVNAEYYFRKAKKIDSGLDVPLNPNNKVLFSLIATRANEDIENDILVPGITFKLINITPDTIDDLKVKIVFLKGNQPISTQIFTVANNENILKGDSHSKTIDAFSTAPVKHVFDDHDLKVQVYVSQQNPPKWDLFRNILIERKRNFVRPVE